MPSGFAHSDYRFHYAPDDKKERNDDVEYVWKDKYEDAEDYGKKGECEPGYVDVFSSFPARSIFYHVPRDVFPSFQYSMIKKLIVQSKT